MPAKIKREIGDIVNTNEILEEIRKNNRIYYKVKCTECNNIREVRADNLNNQCRSCAAKNWDHPIYDDLTGKKFGNWIVLKKAPKSNFWTCQDQVTGVIRDVFRGSLMNGQSKGSGTTRSWGEAEIKRILDEEQIFYIQEYSFPDLLSEKGGHLRFDFAIFSEKEKTNLLYLIEYDGRQHFKYCKNWNKTEENWQTLIANDEIKNKYCKEKQIFLYRINYLDNIQNRLQDIFKIQSATQGNN